jgi:hypothetical protein
MNPELPKSAPATDGEQPSESPDRKLDQELDRELDDTFPASDPLPWSHEVK